MPGEVIVERASSGGVAAELSYRREVDDGYRFKEWRLRIWREGELLVELLVDALPPVSRLFVLRPAPAGTRDGSSLRIVDLNGDGEPEVFVLYWWTGTGCREGSLVWHYVAGEDRYQWDALRDHSRYRLRDLGRDGTLEFVAVDCRFYGEVVPGAASRFPIRIFRWRPGGILYVTRRFPAEVRADAARHLRAAHVDAQSALVPYLADQYLLRRGQAGWQVVLHFWRQGKLEEGAFASSPREYLRKLCAALARLRYARSRASCPRAAR